MVRVLFSLVTWTVLAAHAANLAPPLDQWKGDAAGASRTQLEGREVLAVRGAGEDSAAWRAADLKLEPGGTYAFRFRTLAKGSGTIISGPEGVNRDFSAPSAWTTCGFAFRMPDRAAPAAVRLGQWHLKGEAFFEAAELYPVLAVHRQWKDFAGQLGDGERIEDSFYTDSHSLHGPGSTIHRTLLRQQAGFNSNRWCFSPNAELVYRHDPGRAMSSGELQLNVNYHTGGTLAVSVSKDGQAWTRLAEASKVGQVNGPLPAAVFPAECVFVRLQAEGPQANFQVDSYTFRAAVDYKDAPRIGKTSLLELRSLPPDLTVAAQPEDRGVRLQWTNASDTPRKLSFELQQDDAPPVRLPQGLELPAKGKADSRLAFPPLPAGTHRIALFGSENGKRVCELATEIAQTVVAEADYGQPLASPLAGLDLWTCEGAWKVGRDRTPPAANPAAALSVSAARGEYEPVQLVLRPRNAAITLDRVAVSDLVSAQNKIAASEIAIHEVATVKVVNPSDSWGEPGEFPDPLPPLVTPLKLQAERNQALWVLVHVPENAAAGDYEGTLRLQTTLGEASVPLKLHVFDFALPKETHLRSGFGLNPALVKRYHQLKTREQELSVYDLYMKSFAQHRIAPYSFYAHAPIQVRFEGEGAAKQVKLGWEAFDAAAEKYLDGLRLSAFMLQVQGLGGGTFHSRVTGTFGGFKAGTPEYERLVGDYLKGLESHLREKGWLKKAYVYWFDEPDPKDYPFVVEVMQRMKRHAPGLTRMLTEQPEKELLGHVDLWCGLTPEWAPQTVAERRKAGEEVWWYICCGPKAPYIGLFIEHPADELRLWGWQSWQYGVQGILIWETNYWTSGTAFPKGLQDPWQDPMSYVSGYGVAAGTKQFWGNGDGRFFYPPRRDPNQPGEPVLEAPIPSLRWECLRDGVEDYEYFVVLQQEIERLRGKADAALLRDAGALLVVPEGISKNTTSFTYDVRKLLDHRRRVAEMIERLAKAGR